MSTDLPRECKFAIHIPTKHPDIPDIHLIKEAIHNPDGTTTPNLRLIKNFQRNFYITKKSFQNHRDKKEFELIENLNEYKCTQSDLRKTLAYALDKTWSKETTKELSASPYVYGVDITSTTMIKKLYNDKYSNVKSGYSLAFFDTETDVLFGTKQIIMASAYYNSEIIVAIDKNFISGLANPLKQINDKFNEQLGNYIQQYNLKLTVYLADNPYDAVAKCFKHIHQWQPDFLVIWNMDFDVQKITEACSAVGIDPKHLFSDPIIPEQLKFFKYKQGRKKKVTSSGKVKPIAPSAQWHTVEAPSSFIVIDAMCVYRLLRQGDQEESDYSLDAILNKKINRGKLKFDKADSYTKLKWHQFMQTNYKIEYVIYNIFDSFSMALLDDKTKDLKFTVPTYAGVTDFANFNSQPERISDSYYYYLLKKGKVLGTTGKSPGAFAKVELTEDDANPNDEEEVIEDVKDILSLKNWILTLPAMMTADNGICCIEEEPNLKTNIKLYVFDTDCISSYPTDIICMNVSKGTTKREIITIDGIDEQVFRLQNINCLSGKTNALEYCTTMFNFPKPEELHKAYLAKKNK